MDQADTPSPKPNVLLIAGSLREQSFNRQMAQFVAEMLEDSANASILDWKDVPIFNQDEEFPAPSNVTRVREAVAVADVLWFFVPEYNHGVPGPFKNLIDWLSRPLEDGSPAAIIGKIATVSGVGGSACTRYSHSALLPTLDFLQMRIVPVNFTGMSFDRTMFTSNILQLSEANKVSLKNQATGLFAEIAKQAKNA